MKSLPVLTLIAVILASCTPQTPHAQPKQGNSDRPVGGRCEGCDLYLPDMPDKLTAETTIAGPGEPGERLTISGTIYQKDGKTPAAGIILYLYHTDAEGNYSPAKDQEQAKRHGHLRGWVKTGPDGKYIFHTILPASYPNTKIPKHIHPTIKEAGLTPYYIDDYLFGNDPNLTPEERKIQPKRGGNGIITITKNNSGEWTGQRDIILGLNVPGY